MPKIFLLITLLTDAIVLKLDVVSHNNRHRAVEWLSIITMKQTVSNSQRVVNLYTMYSI